MSAHRNSDSSSSSFGNLLPELLIEIFSRLPVKSTLKFRCVSKAWLALLSDPLSQKNLPPAMSGFFYRHPVEKSLSFTSIYPGRNVDQHLEFSSITSSISRSIGCLNLELLDSCNGLLLFECCDDKSKKYPLIVCNPIGNTWASIDMCHANLGVRLMFDPKTSPHFKVVMITNAGILANDHPALELLIFSSATNDCEVSTIDQGVHLLSAWLQRFSIRTTSFYKPAVSGPVIKTGKFAIINDREDWTLMRQLIPLPGFSLARDGCKEMLGKSGGRVHYAVCCELELVIWMLEDDKSWALKHVTSTGNLIRQHKESRRRRTTAGSIRPLAFHPDLDVIFLQVEWNIYSFHPSSRSFELLVSKRGANPDELPYRLKPFKSCFIADDPLASLPTVRKIGC